MSSHFEQKTVAIEPINWFNLLSWARRTYYADHKTYQSKDRELSWSRISSLALPNLHAPVFLIGAPRSGTTFLGSCLAQIPEISYHFEPIATKAAARYVYQQKWSKWQSQWFYRNVYAWLMRIHGDGDLRFAEKTPRNCFLIPFLAETFSDAKFIHIIRDGRDSALSLNKKPWFLASQANSGRFEPGGYPYGNYAQFWVEPERITEFESTSDTHRCIWVWKRFTETALEAAQQLPSQSHLELRYEDLVFNPIEEGNRILQFLQIDSAHSRNLFHQAMTRVRADSVLGWQRGFSPQQLEEIEREAGELLNSLGYCPESFARI